MNAVEAVGCKVVLRVQKIEEYDPVFRRAQEAGLITSAGEDSKRKQAGIDKGEVLEIGPSCSEHYIKGVNIGDIVGFAKYGGKIVSSIDDPEDKYLIINDEDIVCKFRSNNG